MTTEEREEYILAHYENMMDAQKKLIQLLRDTQENKSYSVQALRNETIKYFNDTERYIRELEADNFCMAVTHRDILENSIDFAGLKILLPK